MKNKRSSILTLTMLISTLTFGQNLVQVSKFIPNAVQPETYFGNKMVQSANMMAVGASLDDYDENGGNQIHDAGAVYIYEKDASGQWIEQQKIVATSRSMYGRFGHSIAMTNDYLAVGAPLAGSNDNGEVYIYEKTPQGWVFMKRIVSSSNMMNDYFGECLDFSGDQLIISSIGGSQQHGKLDVYKLNTASDWVIHQTITASTPSFGEFFGLTFSVDGAHMIVGGKQGVSYMFNKNGNSWTEAQVLDADPGISNKVLSGKVDISGDYAVISAIDDARDENDQNPIQYAGSVYIFKKNTQGTWVKHQKLVSIHRNLEKGFGSAISIKDGVIGVSNVSALYDENGSNPFSEAGAVTIFKLASTGDFNYIKKMVPADRGIEGRFGRTLYVGTDDIMVGVPGDHGVLNGNGIYASGGVYQFDNDVIMSIQNTVSDGMFKDSKCFPNPTAHQNITIQFDQLITEGVVTVRNLLGQTLSIQGILDANQMDVELPEASGVYLIEVKSGLDFKTFKILKQ